MTNRERLISLLGFKPSDHAIDGALIDSSVEGTANYVPGNSNALKIVAIGLLELLLSTPDTTNTEGMKIEYDRAKILERIRGYKIDVGLLVEGRPTITSKKAW